MRRASSTSPSSRRRAATRPASRSASRGGTQKQEAEGTGFEIDSKGDILTAEHVVDGANSIKVQFENGSTAKATLVGSDKSTDTAVIHVDVSASQLHPLALGNSASVQPGQSVVAIGSPFGLPETMTAGIVSATDRTITAPNGFSITGAIQTDAAINHGNSGGPLIDTATNTVIGINDQIESDSNDNAGVGFAVPIDASKTVAQTLIAGGTVKHAYVGVSDQKRHRRRRDQLRRQRRPCGLGRSEGGRRDHEVRWQCDHQRRHPHRRGDGRQARREGGAELPPRRRDASSSP